MRLPVSISRRHFLASAAAATAASCALPFRGAAAFGPEVAAEPAIPGYRQILIPEARLPSLWSGVLARHEAQNREAAGAGETDPWRQLVGRFRGRPLDFRLLADVNAAVNRMRWVYDTLNYGVPDRWATPREFLANGGDCEDFAIAKFLLLREIGFIHLNQRVVICRHNARREAHAVTTCKLLLNTYLLDNLDPEPVVGWPLPTYTPVYGVDERGWVVYAKRNPTMGVVS